MTLGTGRDRHYVKSRDIVFVDGGGRYVGAVFGPPDLDYRGAYHRMVAEGKVHSAGEFVEVLRRDKRFVGSPTSTRVVTLDDGD